MTQLAKNSPVARSIEDLERRSDAVTLNNLHGIMVHARAHRIDPADFAGNINAALGRASDEQLGDLAVDVRVRIEEYVSDLHWVQNLADAALFNRAVARREGDESAKIAIPHERADIELTPEFAPYSFDVDALETVLPLLKDADRAKLLKVEPERQEPLLPLSYAQREAVEAAIDLIGRFVPLTVVDDRQSFVQTLESLLETKTLPRRVSAGATVSITSIADRYRGSNVETLIRAATKREKIRDVLRITPRVSSEPKVVAPQ